MKSSTKKERIVVVGDLLLWKMDKVEREALFCKEHNRFMVYHTKSHSKRTGKAYSAFWACPVRDKLGFCLSKRKATSN